MDWSKFQEGVEERVERIDTEERSLTEVVSEFTEILKEVATKHVGRTKKGRKQKPWMNPPIRAAIRRRNSLRREIKNTGEEVRELGKEAKEEN